MPLRLPASAPPYLYASLPLAYIYISASLHLYVSTSLYLYVSISLRLYIPTLLSNKTCKETRKEI